MEEKDIQEQIKQAEETGGTEDGFGDALAPDEGFEGDGFVDSGFASGEANDADLGLAGGEANDADLGFVDNGFEQGEVGTQTGAKDPILSSVPFVAGTIGAALVLGIVFGLLFGRKRIKKGFDSYEN